MTEQTRVVVTDLRIPFLRLVMFFVKAGLAAIPALIILAIVIVILGTALALLLGGHPTFVIRPLSF